MALVIDADPSSATMNAFCTLAEANTYHESRLQNTAWTSATDTTKNAAIAWGTKQLNTIKWKGARTLGTQPLSFPRAGLSYTEEVDTTTGSYDTIFGSYTTVTVSSTTVPKEIKDATAELAFWLLQSDTTAPTGLEGMRRIKVESIEIEALAKDRPDWLNDAVLNLCKIFMANSSRYSAPTLRVG